MKTEKPSSYVPPIFILSCARSGSTLLRYIVDTHPDMCSPGEVRTGLLCDMLMKVVDCLSLGDVAMSSSQEERLRLSYTEVNRIVSGWMNAYAESRGKRFWCEKSPNNLSYLPMLKNVFPDAKYVCLHRNCMDVVYSSFEKARTGYYVNHRYFAQNDNAVSAYVDCWVDNTSRLLAFERENADRCIRVRYEDLVSNPAAVLKPMFEFMGLTWDAKILDSVFSTHHDPEPGDPKVMFTKEIHKSSMGKGSTISRRYITDDLLEKMNDLLEELGYPPVGPDWDQAPSPYIKAFAQKSERKPGRSITDVSEVFANFFPQRLKANAERLHEIKGICEFVVTDDGEDENTWTIDLNARQVQSKTDNGKSDCSITITRDDLIGMVNGKLNPGEAFLQGRVRVAGDLVLAREVGQLLFGA